MTTLILVVIITMPGCSDQSINTVKVASDKTQTPGPRFTFTELLERDQSLAYDEYVQIKEKYDKLKRQYEKDHKDYESLLKLAEIYVYEARVTGEHPYYYTAALETLNQLLAEKSSLSRDQHFHTLFYKATVELSQHNFTAALKTANKALKLNDMNAGIYGVLVDAHVEIGNYEEAVAACDKMMQIRPDLRSYSRTSYLREIYGDMQGSKKAMVMAINAGAPYSEYKCWAITTLGKIYEAEGKLDSAQICYEFSTQERENYPFGIAGLARIQAKKGETTEAFKLYKQALEILPEIGFNIDLANLKKQNGDEAEFKAMIPEIETMFTEDIESGHNMNLEYASFLYSFKGDFKTALEYGLKEYEERPENIDVNKLLAFVYYGMDDTENAKKHIEIALATAKQDADLICMDGLINSDVEQVRRSFVVNPYQDHGFVDEGKAVLNL